MKQQTDFDAFVRARGPALLRTAHPLTGDPGHAEDLLRSRMDGDPEASWRPASAPA